MGEFLELREVDADSVCVTGWRVTCRWWVDAPWVCDQWSHGGDPIGCQRRSSATLPLWGQCAGWRGPRTGPWPGGRDARV